MGHPRNPVQPVQQTGMGGGRGGEGDLGPLKHTTKLLGFRLGFYWRLQLAPLLPPNRMVGSGRCQCQDHGEQQQGDPKGAPVPPAVGCLGRRDGGSCIHGNCEGCGNGTLVKMGLGGGRIQPGLGNYGQTLKDFLPCCFPLYRSSILVIAVFEPASSVVRVKSSGSFGQLNQKMLSNLSAP
jgi:hypothetical protein